MFGLNTGELKKMNGNDRNVYQVGKFKASKQMALGLLAVVFGQTLLVAAYFNDSMFSSTLMVLAGSGYILSGAKRFLQAKLQKSII